MINRLFQIVYMLLEKPQMTAKELADTFEVSERTIYRDVDKMTMAGIPIYTNQGKHGGISILPNYVLDKSVLTIEEKKKIMESLNALNEVSISVDTFDDEPATVALLDEFLKQNGYVNDFSSSRLHHEIYMSDARKVAPEKWKTVIRHPVKK